MSEITLPRLGIVAVQRSFGGYNRRVIEGLLENGEGVIIKILDAKGGSLTLEEVMDQICQYHQDLISAGVNTASIQELFIHEGQLIETEPVLGETAERIMVESTDEGFPHILRRFLEDVVSPLFASSATDVLTVGLDIGPRNAMSNPDTGRFEYVDLFPPKITLPGGSKTLEFPEPTDPSVIGIGEFRHFSVTGLTLQLLTQLCKRMLRRRRTIQEYLSRFFKETRPELPPIINTVNLDSVEQIAATTGIGYLSLRNIACEVAYQRRDNPRATQWLDSQFQLLHMQDQPVPTQNVNHFKEEVLRWMDKTKGG